MDKQLQTNSHDDHTTHIWFIIALHLAALLCFASAVNFGFYDRVLLLINNGRHLTLVFFLGVWVVSFAALIVAALQPNTLVRGFWAFVISLSTAAGFGYQLLSASNITVYDVLSLWTARHEAGRALDFYAQTGLWAFIVFAISFVQIFLVPRMPSPRLNLLTSWLFWVPAVPIALIAAIVVLKTGGGSQALPAQFQPIAVSTVAGARIATINFGARNRVRIKPVGIKPVRSIVMLIDESVRGDYIDWSPGNPFTPRIAANRDKFVNFGLAVSGGNCSSYSNAILRMGPQRKNIPGTIHTNPTLWQYAKKAGLRTVFIDGQSGRIKDPGKLQNFMTAEESRLIDRHVTFGINVRPEKLDDMVVKTIAEELKRGEPVFIYANKEGAHFPYDNNYPLESSVFQPTMTSGGNTLQNRINSYRNVVSWSVDRLLSSLDERLDLSDAVVIYTSDHGQNMPQSGLTHCSTANANPREALVPLMVMTGNAWLKQRFARGAALNINKASHFAIPATVLELMGYAPKDVARKHDPSLFVDQGDEPPAFTSGDIFGMFSNKVTWNPIDLRGRYLEPEATPALTVSHDLNSRQGTFNR